MATTKPDVPSPLNRALLLLVAFLGGWVIMQLEILGGRLLAPFFGYSVYQWGALIGVVMGALALGYHVGGRIGDRPTAARTLLVAFVVSGLWVVTVPRFVDSYMPAMRAFGPAWGAVAGSTVLLGLPSFLLAMTSPIVIRLTASELIANSAGRVYAVSTIGSIGGTFFAAFYAIPEIGSQASHFLAAVLIGVATAALAVATGLHKFMAAAAAVAVLGIPLPRHLPERVVHYEETVHNIIRVEEQGSWRYLYLNYTEGAQTVMNTESLFTGSYYDKFMVGPMINDAKSALVLGVAGGTALHQLVETWPEIEVTGVDLDPAVLDVAREHFGLAGHDRIDLVAEDARWYLATNDRQWDMIVVDLYVTGHIPFFVTTREFFALVHERLSENGIMMMNILSPRPGDELIKPFVRTARTSFPSTFLIDRGNYILLASKSVLSERALRERLRGTPPSSEPKTMANRVLTTLRPASAGRHWPVFTDERNDVEFRTFDQYYGGY